MPINKYTVIFFIVSTFWITQSSATIPEMLPIALDSGTISPGNVFKISLKPLIQNRYYEITCDIEYPNYTNPDPVILKIDSAWSAYPASSGGVGKITINGREPIHSQILLDRFENKYLAKDVFWINSSNTPGMYLSLRFENFHTSDSVIIKNCFANYMAGE